MQKESTRNYSRNRETLPKKRKSKLGRLPNKLYLDFSIFRITKLTIFESLIKYLKEDKKFTYHKIGLILGRDERNIWTVYNRARRKTWKISITTRN